jgi:hypothetical protein
MPVFDKAGFFYQALIYLILGNLSFRKYLLKSEVVQLLPILQIVISHEEAHGL